MKETLYPKLNDKESRMVNTILHFKEKVKVLEAEKADLETQLSGALEALQSTEELASMGQQ